MNKYDVNIDNIKTIVGDIPKDYASIKGYIVEHINNMLKQNLKSDDINSWMHSYILKLPYNETWRRKHIYLLVRDLLELNPLFEGFDDILYDIETAIKGYCAVDYITRYPQEPIVRSELVTYVRGYHWIG